MTHEACQFFTHGRLALCHKTIMRRAKYWHQKWASQAAYALTLCLAAMDMNGAKQPVVTHQLIAARLQRLGLRGRLPAGLKIYLGIDLPVQIVEHHAIVRQTWIPQPLGKMRQQTM